MGSVVMTWKGICTDRGKREVLIGFLDELAARSVARCSSQPPRPQILDVLTASREEETRPLDDVQRFDGEISGRILVALDIDKDWDQLAAEAISQGVEALRLEPEDARSSLLVLDRAILRGIDFRMFDPRGLYPDSDRMSFVFLESEIPCLDGRLVSVSARDRCELSGLEPVREADWFLECPYLHLRYYLEEWTDLFFSWLKFFFMPDLAYARYQDQPGFETYRPMFEELRDGHGEDAARRLAFDGLLDRFEKEADEWIGKMQDW